MMKKRMRLLLVEDDEVDAMTVARALRELRAPHPLDVAGDGEEALAFLRDTRNERPFLILLDLNMPRMNGLEFLKALKQDGNLRSIPAVVLTTSRERDDIAASYRLSAAGYVVKPLVYAQFVEALRTISQYWDQCEVS